MAYLKILGELLVMALFIGVFGLAVFGIPAYLIKMGLVSDIIGIIIGILISLPFLALMLDKSGFLLE